MSGVKTNLAIPFVHRIICFCISGILCFLCYLRFGDITREFHLNDITAIGVLTIILLAVILRLVFIFVMKYLFGAEKNNIFQLREHIKTHDILLCSVIIWLCGFFCLLLAMKLEIVLVNGLKYTFFIISISALFAAFDLLFNYDDPDLASSQNMEESIGAFWAFGAYKSFYEKILKDIIQKMTKFEEENDVKFLVKKLVMICPLSNNTTGSIDNRYSGISEKGNLKPVIADQGANLDRKLLSTVYCLDNQSTYIAAEMPSPLSTLWEVRKMMSDEILKYHRNCFLRTLKNLLKSYPCIILEYDDLNQDSSESLHDFLSSSLRLRGTISEKEV